MLKIVLDSLDGLVRLFHARRVLREHIRAVGPNGPYVVSYANGTIRAVGAADAIRIDMKDGQATLFAEDCLVSHLPHTRALQSLLTQALQPRRPIRTLALWSCAGLALMVTVGVVDGVKKGLSTTLSASSAARSHGAEALSPLPTSIPMPVSVPSRPLALPSEAASVLKQ